MRNSKDLNKSKDIIKELENNNSFECDFKTIDKDNYIIRIKRVVYKCFLCKSKYHISRLSVRQDKRVQNLITPKKFCASCKNKVDKALDLIKDEIPRHLQPYNPN